MQQDSLEVLVLATLSILATVFVVSLIIFVLLFNKDWSKKILTKIFRLNNVVRNDDNLVDDDENDDMSGTEIGDVKLAPQLMKVLYDTRWVDDATGLIPYSLGILKLCHKLTDRLTFPAMADQQKEGLKEIVKISQKISPRIDDVANAMYPPLEPRLLEARCSALVYAFHLLAWQVQSGPSKASRDPFIQQALIGMEKHLWNIRCTACNVDNYHTSFKEEEKPDII